MEPMMDLPDSRIENEDTYIRGILSIQVEPVILPCEKCHSDNYPNYRNDVLDIDSVLCKRCLDRLTATDYN